MIMARRPGKKVTKFNTSLYALIPFFVAEPYGIEEGSNVEIDTKDPDCPYRQFSTTLLW